MKYEKKLVKEKIEEIGYKIHHHKNFHDTELDKMIEDVHMYIAHSDLTYTEAYTIVAGFSSSRENFNLSMHRIRNTIWKRDRGEL